MTQPMTNLYNQGKRILSIASLSDVDSWLAAPTLEAYEFDPDHRWQDVSRAVAEKQSGLLATTKVNVVGSTPLKTADGEFDGYSLELRPVTFQHLQPGQTLSGLVMAHRETVTQSGTYDVFPICWMRTSRVTIIDPVDAVTIYYSISISDLGVVPPSTEDVRSSFERLQIAMDLLAQS